MVSKLDFVITGPRSTDCQKPTCIQQRRGEKGWQAPPPPPLQLLRNALPLPFMNPALPIHNDQEAGSPSQDHRTYTSQQMTAVEVALLQ
ncbi:hypothetical protein DsansV1_C10g0097861 [Dioscorea sansibarensis]